MNVIRDADSSPAIGLTYRHAAVPVLSKPSIGEVLGQAEPGPDPLQVLRERGAAQQVDLTVREARLDPFLQQLQNILAEDEKRRSPENEPKLWVNLAASPVCRSRRPPPRGPGRTGRRPAGCKAESGSCGGRTGRTRPGRTELDGCCCDRLGKPPKVTPRGRSFSPYICE